MTAVAEKQFGTFAELKVVPLKKTQPATPSLDLDKITVKAETPEEIERRIQEVKDLQQYAQRAAGKVMAIRARRAQIAAIEVQTGWLPTSLQDELKELDAHEKSILSYGDDGLQERVKFSLLIEETRAADATSVAALALLRRVVEMGRFRIATAQEVSAFNAAGYPAGTQVFDDAVYLSQYHGEAGQFALETELRKYLKRVRETIDAEHALRQEREIIAILRSEGNADIEQLHDGRTGTYVLDLPARERNGKPFRAGAALIALTESRGIQVIKVIKGAGSLEWINEYQGKWISFASFRIGKSAGNLQGEMLKFSDRFIAMLAMAIAVHRERKRAAR